MLSPFGLGLSLSPFGGGSDAPFIEDPNLFVWRFDDGYRVLNGTKISSVNELSRGAAFAWEQTTAASQPDAVADGASFPADLSRTMALASPVPLNGALGVYAGLNIYVDPLATVHSTLLHIFGSSVTSGFGRLKLVDLDYTANRSLWSYVNNSDSTLYERALRYSWTPEGQWVTLEVLHDFVTPANDRMWVNGVAIATTLTSPYSPASYPATDSVGAEIGENFYGQINALGVHDGVPSANVRQSFSDWLNSVRPA